ncbi:MAG TPA: pirin family protein, partial [Anaeromyxobacteraceae bacterium]|nr:pirin family protein [Anaeromyxobacteraceae bacterium]
NHSRSEPVHFLQIWILPARRGLAPGYEQKRFPDGEKRGRLRLVASPDRAEGSVTVHQDARIHRLTPGRHAWVQVLRGEVEAGGERLAAGDGAAFSDETSLPLNALADAEILLFDLG